MKILARFEAPAYAALRIIAGAMFAFHGVQKILGLLTSKPMPDLLSTDCPEIQRDSWT